MTTMSSSDNPFSGIIDIGHLFGQSGEIDAELTEITCREVDIPRTKRFGVRILLLSP